MFRTMMKSKIHRATVTEADLNYVGSITIDSDLLKAVDILPNEKVLVVNNNNGERFETYAIAGEAGSGQICANGAAARLVQPGDLVIIMAFAMLSEDELKDFTPKVAFMNPDNTIAELVHSENPQTKFV
ncbi:aspartate 1-decarboxylase [Alicyclobacillus suci]|uniref:aspartate 1-decarboxylase n=1 Tax=Alicyclobacillus suci TaxID=2816080 RepID=UPI0011BD4C9E|nr:aspartate 1-decarboxylase [Alicyclobacillus suci]